MSSRAPTAAPLSASASRSRRTSAGRRRRALGGWSMAIVPASVAAGLMLYPLIYNVWISLHVNRLSLDDGLFVGLLNYRNLFRFDHFFTVLLTTAIWTVSSLVLQSAIGFLAALALDRGLPGTGVARALLLVPWVMPGVVIGAVWIAIYNPLFGVGNEILGWFGAGRHDWLGSSHTALGALVLVNVWKGFPFWMLMLSAGLKTIPPELHEAARLDGAGYLQRTRHVVLPGLRNITILTSLLAFIWTFNYFDLAYTMTNGGPGQSTTTMPFKIYQISFSFNRFDEGSAFSVLTFLLMAVVIGFYMRVVRVDRA